MKRKHAVTTTLFVAAIALTTNASAQKTYSPAQLRSMVQGGNYPRQGSPSTQSESVDYASCIAKIESVVTSVRPNYPTQTVVNTSVLRIEKVWTNDAAMTLSCSAPDKKLDITTAPYI